MVSSLNKQAACMNTLTTVTAAAHQGIDILGLTEAENLRENEDTRGRAFFSKVARTKRNRNIEN